MAKWRPKMAKAKSLDPARSTGSYQNGVVHEVAADVLHFRAHIVLPVLLRQLPHVLSALQALWSLKELSQLICVLLPDAQPEGVDLQQIIVSSVKFACLM